MFNLWPWPCSCRFGLVFDTLSRTCKLQWSVFSFLSTERRVPDRRWDQYTVEARVQFTKQHHVQRTMHDDAVTVAVYADCWWKCVSTLWPLQEQRQSLAIPSSSNVQVLMCTIFLVYVTSDFYVMCSICCLYYLYFTFVICVQLCFHLLLRVTLQQVFVSHNKSFEFPICF